MKPNYVTLSSVKKVIKLIRSELWKRKYKKNESKQKNKKSFFYKTVV
jgi:hypothetical protein